MSIEHDELSYAERSLAIACTRGREAIVARFRDLLNQEDLTEQQWRVLRILYDRSPAIGAEVSELTCIHKASLSRIINSLEQSGVVKRSPSTDDRRAALIVLTADGTALMDRLIPIASDIYDGIVSDLGIDRYRQLLSLLEELAHINDPAVDRLNEQGGTPHC